MSTLMFAFLLAQSETTVKEPAPSGPRKLGAHVGLGVPFLTVGSWDNDFIGRDFGVLGIVGGINVGLDENWSIDFEFIALSDFKSDLGISTSTFVLDPGVVYNWGPFWTGLRLAMRVPVAGATAEFGFIPIIGKSFPITEKVAWYFELDFPIFIQARRTPIRHEAGATFTVFLQTGFGF